MFTLKLAFRGLWRHKVRTGLTLLAISVGYLFLVTFLTMHTGGHGEMIELGIRQGHAGHVVIQAVGYQESRAVELLVTQPVAAERAVLAVKPTAQVAPRVFGGGLARTSADAVGVLFAGVDPALERPHTAIAKHIVAGVYLGAKAAEVTAAEKTRGDLWCARKQPADAPPIKRVVVGQKLAKTLRVGLCDKLVLDAQGLGDREAVQLRVVGIFKTANLDLDAFFIQIPLHDAQQVLGIGNAVHQIAVFVDSADRSHELAEKIRTSKSTALSKLGNVTVLPWDKALPELAEFIWLDANSGWVFMIIIFAIIGIGVLNTVLMSVMERTREFGVMRAVGMKPFGVLQLVLGEGLLLGALGVLVGGIIAAPVLYYLETTGIDLTAWADEAIEMGGMTMSVMYGRTSVSQVAGAAVAVFGLTSLSAIYPAIRAARLRILRAIHHV